MILELPNSLWQYERTKLDSGWNYSTINGRPKGEAPGPRRLPRMAKDEEMPHLRADMGKMASGRRNTARIKGSVVRQTHQRASQWLTEDPIGESVNVWHRTGPESPVLIPGPPTHSVGTFLSCSLPCLPVHWLSRGCQRLMRRWAEKEKRNQQYHHLCLNQTLCQ